MLDRREFIFGTTAFVVASGFAAGAKKPWWEWKGPDRTAEVVPASGLSREELSALLDRIEQENVGRPYIVTRTKQLCAVFAKARLAVRADDTFIDWFPDWGLMSDLRLRHVAAFEKSRPEFAATGGTNIYRGQTHGAYHAGLDASHVCPDWESILELGPKGLADRARKRRETAANDEERLFLDCVVEVYEAMTALTLRWPPRCATWRCARHRRCARRFSSSCSTTAARRRRASAYGRRGCSTVSTSATTVTTSPQGARPARVRRSL